MNPIIRCLVELLTGRVIWRRNRTIRALRRENDLLRKMNRHVGAS